MIQKHAQSALIAYFNITVRAGYKINTCIVLRGVERPRIVIAEWTSFDMKTHTFNLHIFDTCFPPLVRSF